ncbi:MAG TPA: hypothetical protein VMB72_14235 [Acidimicrobiales bacterium]|nr:hypothetical protein [Acidimicrobiales bacterium]
MRIKKGLLVLIGVALPLASVTMLEGTAVAGKVTGTGLTTCSFGGSINFNPPLSQDGTAGAKKEITTVTATLGTCSGGSPVASATSVAVKPIKTKAPKGGNAGTCSSFESNSSTATVKVKVNWNGEKPSKFSVHGLSPSVNGAGEVGFTGSYTVAGSYAGTGHIGVYLTPASSEAIGTCSGSISSLQIDRSNSSGSI